MGRLITKRLRVIRNAWHLNYALRLVFSVLCLVFSVLCLVFCVLCFVFSV
ncbi:DUF3265 domain-containing protein [Vibrio fluvialis]|nr:DUF3265 domain-containing protein [Vibrio fluvialis]MCG6375310.1 DUF3265 domain-containing protein [Vibrio fluvialis]